MEYLLQFFLFSIIGAPMYFSVQRWYDYVCCYEMGDDENLSVHIHTCEYMLRLRLFISFFFKF